MKHDAQVVIFELDKQNYALPIMETKEIIRVTDIVKIPRVDHYIEGIMNLRGNVIPVINLNSRLGLPDNGITGDSRIIVVGVDDKKVGLIVERVNQIGKYSESQVEPPLVTGDNVDFIKGVIKKEENLWMLLDLDRLLN
ncbi:MAG: chemotaxis protein CheW [Bacillota bacterium]|jgi:purine-binding chemotaxis protein CheW